MSHEEEAAKRDQTAEMNRRRSMMRSSSAGAPNPRAMSVAGPNGRAASMASVPSTRNN